MPQTVPNRPTKGAVDPLDRCKKQQSPVEALHLPADGHVHHLFDAQLNAAQRTDVAFDRPLPLAHGRDEQCSHRDGAAARQPCVKLIERLARPEQRFELVAFNPRAAECEKLFEDDGP